MFFGVVLTPVEVFSADDDSGPTVLKFTTTQDHTDTIIFHKALDRLITITESSNLSIDELDLDDIYHNINLIHDLIDSGGPIYRSRITERSLKAILKICEVAKDQRLDQKAVRIFRLAVQNVENIHPQIIKKGLEGFISRSEADFSTFREATSGFFSLLRTKFHLNNLDSVFNEARNYFAFHQNKIEAINLWVSMIVSTNSQTTQDIDFFATHLMNPDLIDFRSYAENALKLTWNDKSKFKKLRNFLESKVLEIKNSVPPSTRENPLTFDQVEYLNKVDELKGLLDHYSTDNPYGYRPSIIDFKNYVPKELRAGKCPAVFQNYKHRPNQP